MYVVGTAGHVDHGKSTLVQALTGIDPDRLREEKARGMTIDLGFAWLTLPSGREISIVDVPGHERFIKNMLAGAGGIDLAILVVAADEGPMPQTREHLAILELLDVPSLIVAVTKCDLVDDELAELVEAETADILASTRFAGAVSVRVSADDRERIARLVAAVEAALDRTPSKRDLGRPRLPIDRAFTIQGFGTVVTGTLLDGALEVGMEVELEPGGHKARIRGLHRHNTAVSRLEPGTRAAVNLSGVHAGDLRRGLVLARPGTVRPVTSVDIRLRAPDILASPLRHGAGITFLSATAQSEGRLLLLDTDALLPGEEAWALVLIEEPMAITRGDRGIVRTSNETAAGGTIVAMDERRHRRHDAAMLERLARQLVGTPEERLIELLASGPLERRSLPDRLGIEPADATALVASLAERETLTESGALVIATAWLDRQVAALRSVVETFLATNPLRHATPREHVRSSLRLPPAIFDLTVSRAVAAGHLAERAGAGLAPPDYAPALSGAQRAEADAFLAAIRAGRYSPPTEHLPERGLLSYLVAEGLVEETAGGVVYDIASFAEQRDRIVEHLQGKGTVTLAEVRDLFGTSRKYAQALLEHLDAVGVTRRSGDVRTLR